MGRDLSGSSSGGRRFLADGFRRCSVGASLLALLATLVGCASGPAPLSPAETDTIARRFVTLAFQLGRHDPYYVDSYYGPPEWRAEAERDSVPLATIAAAADSLAELLGTRPTPPDSLQRERQLHLRYNLAALAVRARLAGGDTLGFAAEARALYDVDPPRVSDAALEVSLAELDSLLPGSGPLHERYQRFRAGYFVPAARLDTVFAVALAECRARTLRHIPLPDSESVTVELVRGQPWGAYNWYQGGYRSLIQVNVDQPVSIDRVIDLACHEGYPGHHVLNLSIERERVRNRGWTEWTLFPLYGPLAVVAEGSASLAPEVAFPGDEQARFEKSVLFPLAGLDSARHERFARVRAALDSLELAGIENARRYLDGEISRLEAVRRGMRFSLHDSVRAERHVRFIERYRSYLVNYGLGKRMVRAWLEVAAPSGSPEERWDRFHDLLREPPVPAKLRSGAS